MRFAGERAPPRFPACSGSVNLNDMIRASVFSPTDGIMLRKYLLVERTMFHSRNPGTITHLNSEALGHYRCWRFGREELLYKLGGGAELASTISAGSGFRIGSASWAVSMPAHPNPR
jgi:hypothetical protein